MKFERIRELRKQNGLSQKEVAAQLGMQLTQYRRYENGERKPAIDFLIQIADMYGVTLDYLVGREAEDIAAR